MLHLREYQVSQWLHDSQSTALDLYSLHLEGQTTDTQRIVQHSNANVTTRTQAEYKSREDQIMIYDNELDAKIAARNEVNALANASFADAVKALEPFVGQKVCKVDGTLLEKVKRALPPTLSANGNEAHTWYSTGHGYSLVLNVKTCKCSKARNATPSNDYQIAQYAESTLYLGHLQNGILTGLYDYDARKTDYTAEFVREARLEVEKADKAKREAESKIHYFGMYD